MKRTLCLLAVCLVPFAVRSAEPAAATSGPPPTVAVLDFEAREELGRGYGRDLSTLLAALLGADPALITVERAELEKILGEQALGLSGTVAPDSASRIGHLLGAKVLVTGRAFVAGDELLVAAKIMGVETGRVYGELVKLGRNAPLSKVGEALAPKIAATVSARADTLVAKVPTRADRVATLRAVLKETRRPTVRVRLPERHLGGETFDPAAQTECELLLREAGFTVLAEGAAEVPDLEFSGEAFSEQAMRRGGLVSCRARVELKAVERASGKVLASDRQASVAVDVSEQVAAKSALAEAAGDLVLRLVPKVVK